MWLQWHFLEGLNSIDLCFGVLRVEGFRRVWGLGLVGFGDLRIAGGLRVSGLSSSNGSPANRLSHMTKPKNQDCLDLQDSKTPPA